MQVLTVRALRASKDELGTNHPVRPPLWLSERCMIDAGGLHELNRLHSTMLSFHFTSFLANQPMRSAYWDPSN